VLKIFDSEIVIIDGLMYQNQPFIDRFTWEEAHEYAKNLRLGAYDDWRLPTIKELQKVRNPELDEWQGSEKWIEWMRRHANVLYKNSKGKICCARKEFVNNMPEYSFFWSSTEYENVRNLKILENAAWLEYFNDIRPVYAKKENRDFVMCVRDSKT
jgi:hypothetical protein